MSTTLDTKVMVGRLQQRVPMSLGSQYCMDRLNDAYQWIEQQGAFVWDVRLVVITLNGSPPPGPPGPVYYFDLTGQSTYGPTSETAPTTLNMATVDVGKPINIFASPIGGFRVSIPFVPADRLGNYQVFNTTPILGIFAAWTLLYNTTNNCYQVRFAPSSAGVITSGPLAGNNYAVQFHVLPVPPLANAPGVYFPTPDQFDTLILDLAEAEIKRNYNLAGWDTAQQKAQASTLLLADQYRSSKMFQPGQSEEGKDAQEAQIQRAG